MEKEFFRKAGQVQKELDKRGIPHLDGKLTLDADVTVDLDSERQFERFLELVERNKGVVFMDTYTYNSLPYLITKDIQVYTYGTFTKRVQQLVAEHNRVHLSLEGMEALLVLSFTHEGLTYSGTLTNPNLPLLLEEEEALADIEVQVDGLVDYLDEREDELLVEKLFQERERLRGFDDKVMKDPTFLACSTKGARMLWLKELAELQRVEPVLAMTKTDLEAYADLLVTKGKVAQKKK